MTIQDALDDVEIAFRQLEFAIKLLSFRELGNIKPSDFDTDHIVFLGNEISLGESSTILTASLRPQALVS